MNAASRPVFYDPFFDGSDAYGRGGIPTNIPQQVTAPAGYRSPSEDTFATAGLRGDQMFGALAGRPLSSVLRPSFKGDTVAPTVIVPPANEGGVPYGVSPNILDGVHIVIDPHIPHQSTELELGQARNFAAAAVDASMRMMPTLTSPRDRRFRAATAYHLIARAEREGDVVPEMPVTYDDEDYRQTAKEREQGGSQAAPARPAIQVHVHGATEKRGTIPMATAGSPPPAPQPASQRAAPIRPGAGRAVRSLTAAAMGAQAAPVQMDAPAAQLLQQQPAAPQHLVHFEMQLFNHQQQPVAVKQDSYFYDVQFSQDRSSILLATRPGSGVWLPPDGENAPDVGVQIGDQPVAYLVQAMPIRYVFQGFELIQLVIKQSGPLDVGG